MFGEFWLTEFGRRAGSGVQPTNRIHSFGVSACHRHHHVAKNICARLHRNGCIEPQPPGKSNVFGFVLRNTVPVFSVMKVWACRLSVRSCQRQRGRMMSTALIVPRTLHFFGMGEPTDANDAQGARGTERTGVSQRLRQHMLAEVGSVGFFFLVLRFPALPRICPAGRHHTPSRRLRELTS